MKEYNQTQVISSDEVSSLSTKYCQNLVSSIRFSESIRAINIFVTIAIIFIGIIGNSLGVFVFIQKRFRNHSSSIYLLILCLSDALFLLMHFFEDTLRTYIDVYMNQNSHPIDQACRNATSINPSLNSFVKSHHVPQNEITLEIILRFINITDRFNMSCRIVNFLRYFLRFLSSYVIITFTIQRTFAIRFPFYKTQFESNRLAWWIVSILIIVGVLLNLWIPFTFEVNLDSQVKYCDIARKHSKAYFYITILYIALTMLIPIVIIFICNSLIILYLVKANKKRASMSHANITKRNSNKSTGFMAKPSEHINLLKEKSNAPLPDMRLGKRETKVFYNKTKTDDYLNISPTCSLDCNLKKNLQENKKEPISASLKNLNNIYKKRTVNSNSNCSNKITRMLMLMSFSYAILNLPYFISWCLFFYKIGIQKNQENAILKNYLYASIQLCEIFYVLNYGVHFFIYCAFGQRFRFLLKSAFK